MNHPTRFAVLLLLLAAGGAGAQEYESEAEGPRSAAPEAESALEEIVVTASRVQEPAADSPGDVVVVASADMEARGARSVADAVSIAAGTAVSDYGAAGAQQTVTIRGSTSSQVLVLVDGVRVSSALSGYADLSTIPAESIERIEVLRTGASALYGSDAVGGVINVITKRKQAPLTVTVENGGFIPASAVTGYGTGKTEGGPAWESLVDSQKVSFSAAPALGDALLRASGGFTRAANAYTFMDSSDEMRLRQNAGLLAGNGALGVTVPLLGGAVDADVTASYKENGVPGSLSGPTLSASQTDERATGVVRYSTDRFLSDSLDLTVTAHAEYADVAYADAESPSDDSDSRLFTAGGDVQQTARVSDFLRLTYGVSGAYDASVSTELGEPERLSVGAFLAPAITRGSLSLDPAVRYDYYSDYAPGAVSGSLGAAWRLSGSDLLKASLSCSYRVPSFEDLYWPSGSGVEGNPDLIPETGYGAEVGYEKKAGGLSYGGVAFARYVKDVILWQEGDDGVWRPSNYGAALYPGAETELALRFLEAWSASVSYTFLYSFALDEGMTLADNLRLPMTPVHTLNATLGYAYDGLSWSVTGRYKSLRYLKVANAAYLPDVFVMDVIMKKKLAERWTVYAAVDNLFGAQYQEVSGYPMPNTEIRLGCTAAF